MFFRVTYTLNPLHLNDEEIVSLKIKNGENEINIELSKFSKDELIDKIQLGDIKCTAYTEKKISAKQMTLFKTMGKTTPAGIQQTISETTEELYNAIKTAVKVFRWKRGISSSHNFIKYGNVLAYSFDRINWKSCYGQLLFTIEFDIGIRPVNPIEVDECNNLLEHNYVEPLGQELFCEAWSQRKNSPRSSLIIGIAALETGFKECVIKLMPQASWLIANIQSPPIIKMLEEYLPTFPAKFGLYGKVLAPSNKAIEILKKGVTMRNNISHGKAQEIKKETLEEILNTIREVLYLFDLYCGHKWASQMFSLESVDTSKVGNEIKN